MYSISSIAGTVLNDITLDDTNAHTVQLDIPYDGILYIFLTSYTTLEVFVRFKPYVNTYKFPAYYREPIIKQAVRKNGNYPLVYQKIQGSDNSKLEVIIQNT